MTGHYEKKSAEYAVHIANRMMEHPETKDAIFQLVYFLEAAGSEKWEDAAWEYFKDRIAFLLSREKSK